MMNLIRCYWLAAMAAVAGIGCVVASRSVWTVAAMVCGWIWALSGLAGGMRRTGWYFARKK